MFSPNRRIFGVAKNQKGKSTLVTADQTAPTQPLDSSLSKKPIQTESTIGSVGLRSSGKVIAANEVDDLSEELHRQATQSTPKRKPKVAHVGPAVETSSDGAEETADYSSGYGNPVQGGAVTDIATAGVYNDVLHEYFMDDNYTSPESNMALNRIYRDIYYNDAICGSVVDLMSTLPFSDFSLSGIKDAKKLDIFVNSVERMRISNLLPQLSIEYQTLGNWLGSLTWDETDKMFTAITPQNMDFVSITQVPIYGVDPLLSLRIPPKLAEFLSSKDPRAKEYEALIPADLRTDKARLAASQQAGNSGAGGRGGKRGRSDDTMVIPLQSENTIFIPRQAMARDYKGVSLFRRVLVPWIIEKALMRGTMDQVYKRQRSISHITAGDEEWRPSNEEMQAIANLFLNADLDPVSAFVVTRNGINVNDIRNGGDFWRWDQTFGDLSTIKLRALGVSESFVTGESNFATMEATLSVMMEQIRNYRQNITREMFYEKTFPLISKRNGITNKRYSSALETASATEFGRELISQQGSTKVYRDYNGQLVAEVASGRSNIPGMHDIDQYVVPEVNWHKRLMPEADAAYLELLNAMEEKGLPIGVRMLAAAGGVKLEKILEGMEDDLKIRQKLGEYGKKIREINKESGLAPDEEGGGGEFASAFMEAMGGPRLKRKGLFNRNTNPEDAEIAVYDSQGKRRVQTGAMRKNTRDRMHKQIASAMSELASKENAKPEKFESNKKYYYGKNKKKGKKRS